MPSLLVLLFSVLQLSSAVKHDNFKTCAQSGFCKRNRALADDATAAGPAWSAPYELDATTVKLHEGVLTATIWKTVPEKEGGKLEFPLTVKFLDDGVARVTIDEARRQKGDIELRGESKATKQRYNEAEKWALVGGENLFFNSALEKGDSSTKVTYNWGQIEVVIEHKPFKVTMLRNGEAQIVLNDRSFMNIEHWRPKEEKKEGEEGSGPDQSTWWDETFGGNTDSKPRGLH